MSQRHRRFRERNWRLPLPEYILAERKRRSAWRPFAGESIIAGDAFYESRAQTADFHAGDIGLVKRGMGHYVVNTGTTDLQFLAVFKTAQYAEVSLSDWLAHTPPELVAQHLNIDSSILAQFSKDDPGILPA